ncbi:uncharacterized protein LOC143289642 [Babylonia areolata]|uniref:uncharacterized protein LOC143289642 n=1 Tax=Babylonia areolata TaxID=304850 RepID=UPI003FD5D20B
MAVFFKQGLRDRVNLLLFSLSLADEVFLVMSMMLYGEEIYEHLTGEKNMGYVLVFFINSHLIGLHAVCFVSFTLSAVIACERCYCVLRPLSHKTVLSTNTMAVIIIGVYAVILGFNFIAVLRYHFSCVYDPSTDSVSMVLSHSEFYLNHKDLVDYVGIVFFGSGLPVVLIIVMVIATAVTALTLQQAVVWRASKTALLSTKEVALTKMLIGTSVLIIVCFFPACLKRIARIFLPHMTTGGRHQNFYLTCLWISEIFLFINSSFNIFVYYLMGSRFRETFWALFRRK